MASQWQGQERRSYARAPFVCRVKIIKKESGEEFYSSTRNIGAGGVCVVLVKDIGLFSEVNLEIGLKDEKNIPIACEGRIVWIIKEQNKDGGDQESYDTGIEFLKLKQEDRARISKAVQEWLMKKGTLG